MPVHYGIAASKPASASLGVKDQRHGIVQAIKWFFYKAILTFGFGLNFWEKGPAYLSLCDASEGRRAAG
jgi:hypothetical protein